MIEPRHAFDIGGEIVDTPVDAPTWADFRARQRGKQPPLVIAHRGAPTVQPENTLASFRHALAQGADVLETDLRLSKDGEFVLIHDATLDRTTDGTGLVSDHTLTELRRYQAISPHGYLTIETVPSLIDLLTMTQGKTPLLLELKDPQFTQQKHAQRLVDTLSAYGVLERTAIVSFDMERVNVLSSVCANLPTGLITLRHPIPVAGTTLFGPAWPLLFANPLYVAHAHRMGSIVAPLDTTPEKRMWYYLMLGVDALLTNTPDRTVAALARSRRFGENGREKL